MTTKNTPALRFLGFTDAWEKRQLGEVASMYSGGTPSITRREYYGGTIPFIRSAEINSNETELFLSEEGLKNSSSKLVNIGDLLYALYGATSGEVGISKIKGAINQAVLAIIPNEDFNSLFISQWLVTEKNNITEKYLQGGQGNLSGTIVKQLEVSFPTHPEQTSIGTFFSQLDRAIALQERKCQTVKNLKKTLLKKMFPENDANMPALRFSGFTDAWEKRQLGEVADIFDGTHQTPTYTESGVKFVSVENISDLVTTKFISFEAFEREYATKKAEYGDVLMTRIGDIGTAKMIDITDELAYYVTLALLKPKNIFSLFLVFSIYSSSVRKELWRRTLHIAFPKKINLGEISEVILSVPNLPEQTAIGTFFAQLDRAIALQEKKLENMKMTKKTLLKLMFI